jgi:hypothetical protein
MYPCPRCGYLHQAVLVRPDDALCHACFVKWLAQQGRLRKRRLWWRRLRSFFS